MLVFFRIIPPLEYFPYKEVEVWKVEVWKVGQINSDGTHIQLQSL
jgi:hypothetical protein